ncbi:MAG: hypothetical protein U0414_31580 [Polyangiaceae bacterium]
MLSSSRLIAAAALLGACTGGSSAPPSSPAAPSGSAVGEAPRPRGARRDVADVTVDHGSGCVVLTDGRVACWGVSPLGLTPELTLVDGVSDARVAALVGGNLYVGRASGEVTAIRRGAEPARVDALSTSSPAATLRAGQTTVCAIDEAGALSCARRDGTPIPQHLGATARDVAVGEDHVCAARGDGSVACFGKNDHLQIGGPSDFWVDAPFAVPSITDATRVSAGRQHSCAIVASGDVLCWGDRARSTPPGPQRVPGVEGAVAIASGARITCAIDGGGGAWCWGDNALPGNLPPGSLRVSGLEFVRRIAVGDETCAITSMQRLYCWGNVVRFAPVKVFGIERARDLSVAGSRSCAITGADRAFCWGGDLTESRVTLTPAPVDVRASQVSAGTATFDGCARTTGGHVDCWKKADHVEPGVDDAIGIATGTFHACALRRGGAVACWGTNHSGELGFPVDGGDAHPTRDVPGIHDAVAIGVGGQTSCAIRGRGYVDCWGFASVPPGEPVTGVHLVVPDLDDAVQIAVADAQSCARRRSGRVVCWGFGLAPVPGTSGGARTVEMPIEDAIDVAAGPAFVCAARASGHVVCWGDLADTTRGGLLASPGAWGYEVQGLSSAARVSVGARHACALTTSGEMFCWGENKAGQIGDRSGPTTPTEREVVLP